MDISTADKRRTPMSSIDVELQSFFPFSTRESIKSSPDCLSDKILKSICSVSPQALSPLIVSTVIVLSCKTGNLCLQSISDAMSPDGYVELVDKGMELVFRHEKNGVVDEELNAQVKQAVDVLTVLSDTMSARVCHEGSYRYNSLRKFQTNIDASEVLAATGVCAALPGSHISAGRVFADARSLYCAMRGNSNHQEDFLFWQ